MGAGIFDVGKAILTAPIKAVEYLQGDPALKWHGSAQAQLADHKKSEFATCTKCRHRITRKEFCARDENLHPFLERTEETKICWTHSGTCKTIEDGTKSGSYKWTCCEAKRKDARGCKKGTHALPSEKQPYACMVFYDGSEYSKPALARALQLRHKGESVALVYLVTDHMDGEKKEVAAEQHKELLGNAVKTLKSAMDDIDRTEVPDVGSFVFLSTKPTEAAVTIAHDLGCTSVLVGTCADKSKGLLGHQGTFSKFVSDNVRCDVIVVKHHASKRLLDSDE